MTKTRALVLALLLLPALAVADVSTSLRDGNAAATANDWPRVSALVDPLLTQQLGRTDLAEAHRLAGLAAFFTNRYDEAELHFLAYQRLELDGQLDPSVYPPEAISFFANVRQKHWSELRALRPKPKGSIWLALLPPIGQLQNGERTKAIVVGSALGVFAVANLTSYIVLRSWCTRVAGTLGNSATCDDDVNRYRSASTLRTVNLLAGIGVIASYVYGVYDGVSGYRRRTREMQAIPYVTGSSVGISLSW
ncbi:MAG: hypothetical protein NT062_01760 [Proteobacteria bacterium]|nr:hypothetical protein [Pseudomonadota bacterium]